MAPQRQARGDTREELLAEETRRFKEAAEIEHPGSTAHEPLLRRAR
jgi:hypothetical protein